MGKPSEVNPTPARYAAWTKANRKREAANKRITHGIVYKLTSPSGKSYVGISKYTIAKRLRWHKSDSSCCHAIKAALKKYGLDSFRKEVLHSNIPLAELPGLEQKAIEEHNAMAPVGYNLTRGGEYNPMDEQAARDKISKAKTDYWKELGAKNRAKAAEWMQQGDARERATASKLASGLAKAQKKADSMPPEAAAVYMASWLKTRERRRKEYERSKARAHQEKRRPSAA